MINVLNSELESTDFPDLGDDLFCLEMPQADRP
jgi:hypothetical protein